MAILCLPLICRAAGSYSGNDGWVVFLHPLDSEDADTVGPGAYTLGSGTTFESAVAKFGNSLFANASNEDLDTDSAISGFDMSDTAETLLHFWWRTTTGGGNQNILTGTNSAHNIPKWRFFYQPAVDDFLFIWERDTQLAGDYEIQVNKDWTGADVTADTWHEIVAYLNAGSLSDGKIYLNGTDATTVVSSGAGVQRATTGFDHLRMGNFTNGLDKAYYLDHLTIIQDSGLSDAKVASLVTQYDSVRGFGFRPTFTSLDNTTPSVGDGVTLTGFGFGLDVTIRVGATTADNIVRVSETSITFDIPDVDTGLHDLAVDNAEASVVWTETDALQIPSLMRAGRTRDRTRMR